MDKKIITELGTVVIPLPFPSIFGQRYKKVGFRFNICAWSIMCQLFDPEIEFHQIEELQKTNGEEIFEKMVYGGLLSYHIKYGTNPVVNAERVHYWLYKLPAEQRDKIVLELKLAILNSKMMGKTMSSIISENTEKKN